MGNDNISEKIVPPTPDCEKKLHHLDAIPPHTKKPLIDDLKNTAHEIGIIKKELKKISEPKPEKVETPTPPENKLFPDKPSLYEQYHKQYQQETRTPKGFLNRLSDINSLKKMRFQNAKSFYDSMRSIGFSGEEVFRFVRHDPNSFSPHVDESDLDQLPKALERLNAIGIDVKHDKNNFYGHYNLDFSSQKEINWFFVCKDILSVNDHQFQKICNSLQPYPFLKETIKDNPSVVFKDGFSLSEKSMNIFNTINEVYKTTPPSSYKSKDLAGQIYDEPIGFDGYFLTKVLENSINEELPNFHFPQFYKTYLSFSSNPDPVIVPEAIRDILPTNTVETLLTLNQIQNKDHQKMYLNYKSGNYWGGELEQIVCQRFFSDSKMIDRNVSEQITKFITSYEAISNSPSKEILRIQYQLLNELIKQDNPQEAFQKISDIFLKNNLPQVGKIYKIFEALHPSKGIQENLSRDSDLSPVLRRYSSHEITVSKIIFNDLIKIHLESGNISLRNYLQFFADSSPILEKVRNGGQLNTSENQKLTYFLNKLNTLYDNSLLNKINKDQTSNPTELKNKVDNLYEKYQVKNGQTIANRVAEMFLKGVGLNTIEDALKYIKNSQDVAHQRNIKNASNFSIQQGDLLKGIDGNYLGNILNNGSVAKEYLGPDANSDATPFDTDTIQISSEGEQKSIKDIITLSPSHEYGDLAIVVKNRGQFQETSNQNSDIKYQPNKLEIFHSNVVDAKGIGYHTGVRTGFPSSEIDYLIVQQEKTEKELENIYYEIAKNGFYIPVVNIDGQTIFSPEDYSKYRKVFDGVQQFDGNPIVVQETLKSDWSFPLIQDLKKEIGQNTESINKKDFLIREKINTILSEIGVNLKDNLDTSILGAKLQNIGSSGRNTNLPNDFDFDYSLILDGQNQKKSLEIKQKIEQSFSHQQEIATDQTNQIRLSQVNVDDSGNFIDLDVGINTVSDSLIFSSNEAIEQKLGSIKKNSGENSYQEVVANIILAKKILKENHAYKKGDYQDGGLGGIGVENWILSNNGNIRKAFETFWSASHKNGEILPIDEFRKNYPILDAGENLRETGRNHDNFTYILTEKGYQSMIKTIRKYI